MRSAAAGARNAARTAGRSVEDLSRDSVQATARAIGGTVEQAREALGSAAMAAREVIGSGADLVFRETKVPVLLLPTGSGPGDFESVYSFGTAISELRSGLLVRPRLDVWAGRSDICRDTLGRVLSVTFQEGMQRERREVAREGRALTAPHKKDTRRSRARQGEARRGLGRAGGWARASAIAMLFATNPLFDLILLMIALSQGAAGVRHALGYVAAGIDVARGEQGAAAANRELEKLSKELEGKGKIVQEAMGNLEIAVHPILQQLVIDFSAVDGILPPAESPADATSDAPDVWSSLQDPWYRRRTPAHLHPLLDVVARAKG